ncbi:MAG: indole-3-glycerol phosphate synthase TrpC [Treponema sp.]|jgi:indole-3-glycerol phosphate synthase|nr:indole-3-glycerol phosphate synthase TrpC [Treponema sp.]
MILDNIAAATKTRVARARHKRPLEAVKDAAQAMADSSNVSFETALSAPGISFICEVKKASPSKGVIAEHFPYLNIARDYAEAGAAAVSVLTEPDFFQGSNDYLQDIAQALPLPTLRKDFIIDEYQIYEAKTLGAAAILLICALLDTATLARYIEIAGALGLACLVETHNAAEIAAALAAGARIIGVNNRDLKTFHVDIGTTARLRRLIPPDKLVVSESGIQTPKDIAALLEQGVDAALIGEALMRAADKKQYLAQLRGV